MKTKINLLIFALVSFLFVACNNDQPKDPRDEIIGTYSYIAKLTGTMNENGTVRPIVAEPQAGSISISKSSTVPDGIEMYLYEDRSTVFKGVYLNGRIIFDTYSSTDNKVEEGVLWTNNTTIVFNQSVYNKGAINLYCKTTTNEYSSTQYILMNGWVSFDLLKR